MDCKSLYWQREPEDIYVVGDALLLVRPTYIIYPSYMYDIKATLALIEAYTELFNRYRLRSIPCVEGASREGFKRCLESYKSKEIAIPNHTFGLFDQTIIKDRFVIYIDNCKMAEELVGYGDGILVTSLPIRLGLLGRLLSNPKPMPPSLTYTEDVELPALERVIDRNVKEMIELYEEGSV